MKLKTQIVLVLVFIIALLAIGLALQQIRAIRISIGEEIETAGDIGTQVLSRVHEIYQDQGARPMQRFLTRLGRLRAHDIVLLDEYGVAIYRTPASAYLDNMSVPAWFARAVSPAVSEREFLLSNGKLIVRTDGSRATLEGWQEFRVLLLSIAIGFTVLSLLAWWLVDRTMRPFDQVTAALRAVGDGDYQIRLPELPGGEARAVGNSFNNMIGNLEASIAAREAEALTRAELEKNRELTRTIQTRIEVEHRSLAQELHDELGQHVTAIKSMAVSLSRRIAPEDSNEARTASLIAESADSIHAAIHQMLTRLRPASLDQFGLDDAIADLVSDWRIKHSDKRFVFASGTIPENIGQEVTTAAYRIAQEAITNAVRHSGAKRIESRLSSDSETITLEVEDNGIGDAADLGKRGFGISGMQERATAAAGILSIEQVQPTGIRIRAVLPLRSGEPE